MNISLRSGEKKILVETFGDKDYKRDSKRDSKVQFAFTGFPNSLIMFMIFIE